MSWESLGARLERPLLLEEPMAKHTSFKIGGPAECLARPGSVAELEACLEEAAARKAPVFLLAGGTNLLVRDGGLRGLVLQLEGEFNEIVIEGRTMRAGAGAQLALMARKASLAGLTGLEFGIGVPGSLGGGLVMNAGAHGQDLSGVVRRIGFLEGGAVKEIEAAEAGFQYRDSRFKNRPGLFLLWAVLELAEAGRDEIEARMKAVMESRKASQPQGLPNAGCVFKNPEGASAGRLIDQAGLKGRRLGGAEISAVHANFVVNNGGATASDVLGLMDLARQAVQVKFGVKLENEVLVVGEA